MSILIQFDSTDTENMLELTAGQYYYDSKFCDIVNSSTNTSICLNRKPILFSASWMNYFVVQPMTKVTIYDSNQCIEQLQYTGSTYIVNNYNTKKSQRIAVSLYQDNASDLIDNVHYIVIEQLDAQRCKRNLKKYKDGVNKLYLTADKHKFKHAEEPIIKGSISIFTHNASTKVIEYVVLLIALICLLTFASGYCLKTYKYWNYNNTSNNTSNTAIQPNSQNDQINVL